MHSEHQYFSWRPYELYPYTSGSGYSSSGNRRWPLIAGYGIDAALHVPSGAIIDYLEFDFCDNNPTFDITLTIRECNLTGSSEAFAAAGITVGCTSNPPFPPPVYCPDRNVTRREMAIFFAKALGLHFPN